jgi:translation elongation factor EF-G
MQYFRKGEVSLGGAFKWVTNEGVLAGEPLRGVRPNLLEGMTHI